MNYLAPTAFELVIPNRPNVEFFVQRASIPGISMNPAKQPTRFNPVFHSPDNMQFSEFNVAFIVDERMANWIEIYNWMVGASFPRDGSEYDADNKAEVSLLVKNSSYNPNVRITFQDAFPISMSEVQLDVTAQDILNPVCDVAFQYDHFSFSVD